MALILRVWSADLPAEHDLSHAILKAMGDPKALARFKGFRAIGTMEGLNGFPGTLELVARAPADRLLSWDIRYLHEKIGVAGNEVWDQTSAVREVGGPERERAQRDARFQPLYRLLKSRTPFVVASGKCLDQEVYLLTFSYPQAPKEVYGVNTRDFTLRCQKRTEIYEEGSVEISTQYGDYRRVSGLNLPFSVTENRPDNTIAMRLSEYQINPIFRAGLFDNPERQFANSPIEISLDVVPAHIYKEQDGKYTSGPQRYWGAYFYPSESWSFDVLVHERHGRFIEPASAHIELAERTNIVAVQEWSATALNKMRRVPVSRFSPRGELYGIRHNMAVPQTWNVDHLKYTFTGTAADGHSYSATLDLPVTTFTPKTHLIFPMKGKFLVTSGHEFYELEHKYERSQQFAIDIVALGDNFEFATNGGARMEDYVGWARREIIAPAAGRVVYARNDIPDGEVKSEFLKAKDALQAIAGNLVIIDHGNNEFSVFCHMHQGSVRVKTGDIVAQGEAIGLLGASGSPGLPHLHYQLQNGPDIFGADGLPLKFENIERVAWLGKEGSEDEHGPAAVDQPKSGIYMEAH